MGHIQRDKEKQMLRLLLAVWLLLVVVILVFMWSSQKAGEAREEEFENEPKSTN